MLNETKYEHNEQKHNRLPQFSLWCEKKQKEKKKKRERETEETLKRVNQIIKIVLFYN